MGPDESQFTSLDRREEKGRTNERTLKGIKHGWPMEVGGLSVICGDNLDPLKGKVDFESLSTSLDSDSSIHRSDCRSSGIF